MKKTCCVRKILKCHKCLKKTVLSINCGKWQNKDGKIIKEQELIEVWKILGLTKNTKFL